MTLKALATSLGLALSLAAAPAAHATTTVLTFAGLNGFGFEPVQNYYDGGYGGYGSGPGPNDGITFTPTAYSDDGAYVFPGGPDAQSMFFLGLGPATMNVPAGFTTGLSLYYFSFNGSSSIRIWSGVDATGTLLATLDLPIAAYGYKYPGCFPLANCPFVPASVAFSGVARSVDFSAATGIDNFAEVTLGSTTPGGVPEPATWSLMLLGVGGLGAALRATRRARSGAVGAR